MGKIWVDGKKMDADFVGIDFGSKFSFVDSVIFDCDLAKKCQPGSKGKGRKSMGKMIDKNDAEQWVKKMLSGPKSGGMDMSNSPSFLDSVLFDKKSGMYLPVKKWDGSIAIPADSLSTTASGPVLGLYTGPWELGVYCMLSTLMAAGFHSMRLAEQMYLASRVFDHNLAARASQHKMRVR